MAQRAVATSLDATVSKDTVLRWTRIVAEYKKDPSKPNPFEESEVGTYFDLLPPTHSHDRPTATAITSVRRELLQEESDARKQGNAQLHETTPASFLRRALDIEEKQYVYFYSISPVLSNSSDEPCCRNTVLLHQIASIRENQPTTNVVPSLAQLRNYGLPNASTCLDVQNFWMRLTLPP